MIRPCHRTPIRLAWLIARIAITVTLPMASVAAAQSGRDEPGFETNGALPWEEPPGAVAYLAWGVTDGDTFAVIEPDQRDDPDPWWEPVRMIGVDAPEKD